MTSFERKFIVPGSGGYGTRCVLCDTGTLMGRKSLRSHLGGAAHKRNCQKFETANRVSIAKTLNGRIHRLGLPRWRHQVQSMLLQYIQSSSAAGIALLLQQAERVLAKYEKMERLSLLELAVWKASLQNDPLFETMDDLDAYWTLERGFDPIAYKNERRVTSGISVIIQGVLPFLE